MEVTTQSDKLKEYRKMAVQLLLAERTHICSVCVANDHCELQAMANKLGVDHVMFERNWTSDEVDSTHDFLGNRPQPMHPLHKMHPRLRPNRRRPHP